MHCCALATPTVGRKHRRANANADQARQAFLWLTSMTLLLLTKLSLSILHRTDELNPHQRKLRATASLRAGLQYDAIAQIARATLGLGTVAFDYLAK